MEPDEIEINSSVKADEGTLRVGANGTAVYDKNDTSEKKEDLGEDSKKVVAKDESTLLVDEDSNFTDIYDLLDNNSEKEPIVRIKNLIKRPENQVSIDQIASLYRSKAEGIVTLDEALKCIQEIFVQKAKEINEIKGNGIYIDLGTGEIDRDKSRMKAQEFGLDMEYIGPRSDIDTQMQAGNSILNNTVEDYSIQRLSFNKHINFFSENNIKPEDFYKHLDKNAEDLNVTNEIKSLYKESKNKLDEFDINEMTYIKLCMDLEAARNTPYFEQALRERNDFLYRHRKFGDGSKGITPEQIQKREEFELAMSRVVSASLLDKYNSEGIESFTKNDKIIAAISIMGTMKNGKTMPEFEALLEKLCPGYDKNADESSKYEAIGKAINFTDENGKKVVLTKENAQELVAAHRESVFAEMQRVRKKGKDKIPDEAFNKIFENSKDEIDVRAMMEEHNESKEEKYFKGSQLSFGITFEKDFLRLYQRATKYTWISTREEAEKYRYAYLLRYKDILENNQDAGTLFETRLEKVNQAIEEIEKKNPDINIDDVTETEMNAYEDLKIKAKLTQEFLRDETRVTSREDYDKMTAGKKKAYLKNTIVALKMKENNKDSSTTSTYKSENNVMGKFARRRLEILNTSDNQFVQFQQNEGINYETTINKQAILDEYNKLGGSHFFATYEELERYCELNQYEYVNTRLEEIVELEDSDFFELTGNNMEEDVRQIEQYRMGINEKKEELQRELMRRKEKRQASNNSERETKTGKPTEKHSDRKVSVESIRVEGESERKGKELIVRKSGISNIFDTIKSKIKDIFGKNNENQNVEASETKNTVLPQSDIFRTQTDGKVEQALRITEENSRNQKNKETSKGVEETRG